MPVVIGLSLSQIDAMSSSFLHTTHTTVYCFSPRLRCAVVMNVIVLYAVCSVLYAVYGAKVDPEDEETFRQDIDDLGYRYFEETNNPLLGGFSGEAGDSE